MKKSKFQKKCLARGSILIIGAVIVACYGASTPDSITPLGISVWTNGHEVDLEEIDRHFLEVDKGLDYGDSPATFDLHIHEAICESKEDGTEKCYFSWGNGGQLYAGVFDPPDGLHIHLSNGAWTLEQSAYRHEVIHYAKYWHNRPDWKRHDGDGWDLQ